MSTTEADIHSLRYQQVRKVTLVGSLVDFLLGVAKIIVGWLAHSQALIADGVHSLSDLATDFLVLYAAKHAHRAADEDHPYGHGRIETLATVGTPLGQYIKANTNPESAGALVGGSFGISPYGGAVEVESDQPVVVLVRLVTNPTGLDVVTLGEDYNGIPVSP